MLMNIQVDIPWTFHWNDELIKFALLLLLDVKPNQNCLNLFLQHCSIPWDLTKRFW